jgi:dihydrofolate synthase/folylpolyglutamate synthase
VDAIDEATALAEAGEAVGTSIGSGAVLVTGSVVTVGEARALLHRRERATGQEGTGG